VLRRENFVALVGPDHRLARHRVGIAIAPRSLASGTVVAVPVADPGIRRPIGLAWRPELPEHPLAATLDAVAGQVQVAGLTRPAGPRSRATAPAMVP
jgi:DNA-binding transcriptional LysR family regulator